jgi:alpha-glucosidase (family GH31 glycosyl hydrolase)
MLCARIRLLEIALIRWPFGLAFAAISLFSLPVCAVPARPAMAPVVTQANSFDIPVGQDRVRVALVAANILHVQFLAAGKAAAASLMIDPALQLPAPVDASVHSAGVQRRLDAKALHVIWDQRQGTLTVMDAARRVLLRQDDLAALGHGRLSLRHDAGEPLYGIGGYNATEDATAGLLRNGTQKATAGEQGHAGAPFVWTTTGYGVLLDSIGANFTLADRRIDARTPKGNLDYYVIVGHPAVLFGAIARLTGASPLFPKWAMGFTNSQWGIDQKELLGIVDGYRARHIPIDNFTLDFDWKAWGQDDCGEFRWNPATFPGGPDGSLKRALDARGIHLTGIMKPRVHVDTVEGRYLTEHKLWFAAKPASNDYFSHKPVKDVDFDQPAARAWFFNDALKHSFDTGMVGWWNDEADDTGDDTQFMNMQRALYEGQRAYSPLRVWSINRNFYLGAQRYAYGLWSGDIATGFASMAAQRVRMLSAIDVGAMQWGMDGGGFNQGTPTPENYARWIQFGAFTPIFRVHGELGQKRQPWVYGPIAERAATAAIRLRYTLIPYIYSYEYTRRDTGVGLVRPLLFDWPHDLNVRNDVDAWMFGEGLLVSPVVVQGQTVKDIYLPAGTWTDWFSGKVYRGGQTIHYTLDTKHWCDIPLFVRRGAIIPTQPPMDYVGQRPLAEVTVEIFPDAQRSRFDYYDDDGVDYRYEQGDYFRQTLSTQKNGSRVTVETGPAEGRFKPALRHYLLKIHASAAVAVADQARALRHAANLQALQQTDGEAWAGGHDRFGAVTWVRLEAARQRKLVITLKD